MEEDFAGKALCVSELILKYLQETLVDEEQQELNSWIAKSDSNRQLFSELTNQESLDKALTEFYQLETRKKAAFRKLKCKFIKPYRMNQKLFKDRAV